MDAAGTLATVVAPVAAVTVAAAVVLRDVVAYDRRGRHESGERVRHTEHGRHEAVPAPEPAAERVVEPVAERHAEARAVAVAEPATAGAPAPHGAEPADDSMLGALTTTDEDVRSPLRRVVSLLVLLTLTLAAAGVIGAGIYEGISRVSGK